VQDAANARALAGSHLPEDWAAGAPGPAGERRATLASAVASVIAFRDRS